MDAIRDLPAVVWLLWVVSVLLPAGAGVWVGRGRRVDLGTELHQARVHIAYLEGRLEGRAERPPAPASAPTPGRVPAWPELAAPETVDAAAGPTAVLPQVGSDITLTAADHLVPGRAGALAYETLAALGPAGQDADAALDRTWDRVPEPAGLDLAGAYDVFGTDDDDPTDDCDDGGDDGGGDEPGPPSALQPPATTAYAAAMPLPRYDWGARWDPLAGSVRPPAGPPPLGVPGRGWGWPQHLARVWTGVWVPLRWVRWVRWVRWTVAGWSWRYATRAEAREYAEAARLLGNDGPGALALAAAEPTQALPVVARAKVTRPRLHQARHVWGQRMISAASLLSGTGAELPPGRHRFGVAPGTSAQLAAYRLPLPGDLLAWAHRVAQQRGRSPLLGVNRPAARLS